MLVVISDLHLNDGTAVKKNIVAKQVHDFWHNINRTKRKILPFSRDDQPLIELVVLGDFIDVLRSNVWNQPEHKGVKPWSPPSNEQKRVLEKIADGVIRNNHDVLHDLKRFIDSRQVRATYMIGNHDHLLVRYPDLFQKIHKQLGFEYPEDPDPAKFHENFWPEYGVLAHHGDRGDPWNDTRGFLHPIGDAMVTEIYNQFPQKAAQAVAGDAALIDELEDLVYVRPYRVAPFWIIQVARKYGDEAKVKRAWNDLVDAFLEIDFVKMWIDESRKSGKILNHATALRTTLKISTRLEFSGWISFSKVANTARRIASADPPGLKRVREELKTLNDPRIRYLVNGHTHNPGVMAFGRPSGKRFAYVNTGTWTRTLLPDRLGPLEPVEEQSIMGFTPGEFISYALFYKREENPKQDMEFWSGRIHPRED